MTASTAIEDTNLAAVRAYVAAVEGFDFDSAARLLQPDVIQIEFPNLITPKGATCDLPALRAGMESGRKVLSSQRYLIESELAHGDKVALECRWEGVLKVPLGVLKPGDTMVAHICMTFVLRDGRIARQHNYDCFEAFARAKS